MGRRAVSGGKAPLDVTAVESCAAQGLDTAEVRERLGLHRALSARAQAAFEGAMRRGRLLGRATIKEAQFKAARDGRTSAQVQVLARLGAAVQDGADEAAAPEVRRRIIGADAGAYETETDD